MAVCTPAGLLKLLLRGELVLANAAYWACPVIRKIFKLCSRCYAVIRITFCRVILISTCVTYVNHSFLLIEIVDLNDAQFLCLQER